MEYRGIGKWRVNGNDGNKKDVDVEKQRRMRRIMRTG